MPSEVDQVRRALVRFNALVFATVFGMLAGAGLWFATTILVLKGGENPGPTLGLLRAYFPGYTVTWGGAFVGLLWASLVGFTLSLGPAALFYRGVLGVVDRSTAAGNETSLMKGTARIHVPSFAIAFGLFTGSLLFLATLLLLISSGDGHPVGPHLSLLDNYLPGYRVSIAGAAIGFVYLFVIGFAAFALAGILYNRIIGGESQASSGQSG